MQEALPKLIRHLVLPVQEEARQAGLAQALAGVLYPQISSQVLTCQEEALELEPAMQALLLHAHPQRQELPMSIWD